MALATLSIDINARMANIERDMGRAAQIAERNAQRMERAFAGVGTALSGLGALLGAGTFGLWIRGAVDAAAQVEKLAQVSGAGAEEFQRYAVGAKSVGFEADKLADIFKDVNDKVGDFLSTGGGELKDFFENVAPKVGVTAEQFRNLSGPQALQLYFNALQKANVSQAEMTFYMEAIANDATMLAPLLANNGARFRELADEAERLGGIFSDDLTASAKEFNDNLAKLDTLSQGVAARIGNVLIPVLNEAAESFLRTQTAGLSFWEALKGTFFDQLDDPTLAATDKLKKYTQELKDIEKQLSARSDSSWGGASLTADLEKRAEVLRKYIRMQQNIIAGEDNRDPRDRIAERGSPPSGGGGATKPGKTKKSGKAADPLGDFAKDAEAQFKPYEDALRRFQQIQLDATASTADLTQSEKAFFDLINSEEWASMSAPLQEKVRASFEAANATERLTESEKRLRELLTDSVLEQQRADMQLLADAYIQGAVTAEQYGDAVQRALGNIPSQIDPIKDEFADLKRAIEGWGQDSAQAIVDFAITGKSSFSDMIESMLADLAKMMVYKNVTGPMANAIGSMFGAPVANALGNVYSSPSLSAYSNQIHDSPKFFQFANGGVFGEAGPEAIMPLSRDSRGRLGVKAEGAGGVNLETVRVEIKNEGTQRMEVASAQPRFDAEGLVVGVVLRDLRSNGPIRQALGA